MTFFLRMWFLRNSYDSCVYMLKREEKCVLFLLLYADDILIASIRMKSVCLAKGLWFGGDQDHLNGGYVLYGYLL